MLHALAQDDWYFRINIRRASASLFSYAVRDIDISKISSAGRLQLLSGFRALSESFLQDLPPHRLSVTRFDRSVAIQYVQALLDLTCWDGGWELMVSMYDQLLSHFDRSLTELFD